MVRGRVKRPEPETLRKLALGLATDPDTGEVDRLKRDQALSDLSRGAGYPDADAGFDADELVRVIQTFVGNQQATEFWVEMVRVQGAISPTLQNMIRTVIELHNRPGGADVTALLLALDANDWPATLERVRRLLADGELARS